MYQQLYVFPSNVTVLQQHYKCAQALIILIPHSIINTLQSFSPPIDPNVTTDLNIFNFSLYCNYIIIFLTSKQTQMWPQIYILKMPTPIILHYIFLFIKRPKFEDEDEDDDDKMIIQKRLYPHNVRFFTLK